MTRRRFGLVALLCVVLFGKAQYNTSFLNHTAAGRGVFVDMDYEAGSRGMTEELGSRLFWGGHISNQTKAESARMLSASNNMGVMLNYGLSTFFKGNKRFDWLVSVKNQELINSTYSRDFFNLMFYGNGYFRGGKADLSNSNVNALRFQEVKLGAMLHHIDTLGKIGMSISFLKGEQLFYVKTRDNSSLYTSFDGSQIVFQSNFNMALSDTGKHSIMNFNGIGAAADLYFETPYKSKLGRRSVLSVNANNIGFIHWRNNSVQYSSDSTLKFAGYQVNSITDLRDSTLNRINRDTLLKNLANAHKENFNVNIPTNLVMMNRVYFGAKENYDVLIGFRYVFNANYKGYFFLEPSYHWDWFTFTLHAGYGGYARFNMGCSITCNTPKFFARIGSNALQGFVTKRQAFSQGVFFSLGWKIK